MIGIGVDYYPEHWEREIWEKDAELMAQTGVKLVRLAEFAWCRLEPHEEIFDFGWLDEAVEIFARRGIGVILCTPTNCPPLWVYEKYPDTLRMERSGEKIATGIRGHRCYSSQTYRRLCRRIITKLVTRYKDNPAVVAWQIDNELDAVTCCCDECAARFRKYLRGKYGSLAAVNEAYGNAVWSGEYSSWEQVKPPFGQYNEGWYNPGYMLDWKRFCKLNVNDYLRFQAEIIRAADPKAKLTTNTWLCADAPDYCDMFSELDFVSFDNYPTTELPADENALYSHAFHLDFMRGIKGGRNFCIMEQLSGTPGCWMPMQPAPKPGMIKGYSLQAAAHGADSVVHFRWRSARKGAEMFWHGLIDHSGVLGRRFREFAELCREFGELENDLEGSVIKNDCAILFSSDSLTALDLQPQTDGFHYFNQMKSFHDALTCLGVGCDIIDKRLDFSAYKLLIVPTLFVADPDTVRRIYAFAENGGTVIVTNRSGVKGMNNECLAGRLPCALAELCGCEVDEYDSIGWGMAHVKLGGREYEAAQWCDILETCGGEEIAAYTDRFYSGRTAAVRNEYGGGRAYYVGFCARRDFYRDFMRSVLEECGLPYIDGLPRGAEITVREKENLRLTFVFNNTDGRLDFSALGKAFSLAPFEMKILKEGK